MSVLKNLSNRFQYYAALALAEDGPQEGVRAELMKKGWSFKPALSNEEIINTVRISAIIGPAGCIVPNRTKVLNEDGVDIFSAQGTPEQRQRYKADVRQAAARVYNINP